MLSLVYVVVLSTDDLLRVSETRLRYCVLTVRANFSLIWQNLEFRDNLEISNLKISNLEISNLEISNLKISNLEISNLKILDIEISNLEISKYYVLFIYLFSTAVSALLAVSVLYVEEKSK